MPLHKTSGFVSARCATLTAQLAMADAADQSHRDGSERQAPKKTWGRKDR